MCVSGHAPGLDGRKVCSQEHISLITDSLKNDFAFIYQFQHKGTEILDSILYLSLLHVCNLEKTYYFPLKFLA